MRLVVIGDVGGHADTLRDALCAVGADPDTGHIPEDTVVCQVGDLVHRGPDSPGVVSMVENFRIGSPGRWIQLVGNHEAIYLKDRVFSWNEELPEETVETIRNWWEEGWMKAAAAVESPGTEVRRNGGGRETVGTGGLLLTHAGLGCGLWERIGKPADAWTTARLLEDDARSRHPEEWRGAWALGMMITGTPTFHAGVVWTSAEEAYLSWLSREDDIPGFSQAHGHSQIYSWRSHEWVTGLRLWEARNGKLRKHADEPRRLTRVEIGSMTMFGTDPGHGREPVKSWNPLILGEPG